MATSNIDPAIVHLAPNRSIRFPIRGDRKLVTTPILSATFTWVRDHPNSSSSGSMKNPNVNWTVPRIAPIDSADTAMMYQPR
jgi:hypothetical protein